VKIIIGDEELSLSSAFSAVTFKRGEEGVEFSPMEKQF
jgi:hypothetical protein